MVLKPLRYDHVIYVQNGKVSNNNFTNTDFFPYTSNINNILDIPKETHGKSAVPLCLEINVMTYQFYFYMALWNA